MNTGVYSIRNTVNGKRYIGSAAMDFTCRWNKHRSDLRRGVHHSAHLQAAWNKYGEKAFVFCIVETCNPIHATAVEQVMIDHYRAADGRFGYNIAPVASSPRGIKRRQETKDRISLAKKGKPRSPETVAKMRLRKMSPKCAAILAEYRSQPVSAETRARMSLSQRGRKHSEQTRRKMSESMSGLKRSEQTCRNIAVAQRGKRVSESVKARISASLKGRSFSDETRLKMSVASKNRRHNDATKEKLRLYWAVRRASKAVAALIIQDSFGL